MNEPAAMPSRGPPSEAVVLRSPDRALDRGTARARHVIYFRVGFFSRGVGARITYTLAAKIGPGARGASSASSYRPSVYRLVAAEPGLALLVTMGIEHFYQIIDRAVVDPFLALTWLEFHRRYGWKGTCQWASAADYLMEFGLDEEADEEKVARILARRSLRWTMLRCSPQFYFLDVVFTHAADVRRRCPEFWIRRFADHQLMLSAAVGGFLNGRLKKQNLRVVLALLGGPGEAFSLEMPRTARRAIENAITPWEERPAMFPWQPRGEIDGSCPLGIADTRRFLEFVQRSWSEKWPCPYLGRDTSLELPKNHRKSPTMRDSLVAGKLVRWIRQVDDDRLAKLCIFRHFD